LPRECTGHGTPAVLGGGARLNVPIPTRADVRNFTIAIDREIVDDIAEVDIGRISQRDEMGETNAAAAHPVQQRRRQRAGLGDERDRPGLRRRMRETRVQRERRHQQADAVGTEDAQQMRPHRGERGLRQRPAAVAECVVHAGGKHDCRLGAARAQFRDDAGYFRAGTQITARSGAESSLPTSATAARCATVSWRRLTR